ncbi:Hypothetical predicted protein [Pelobates cultripes]|uniref:Uncharacterized protein n=1 Tax=Pelobates cultripes TaxID=61616 RepID=A0AAD1T6N8_PELCU|nr:Hypothetical predicted protein [Pelobates cultripes]
MGNSVSNLWSSMNILKKGNKKVSKKRKSRHSVNTSPPVAPMYDTVADMPVYAVVDKNKKHQKSQDDVQYAEIQVFNKPRTSQKTQVVQSPYTTEYATIAVPKYNAAKGTLV